MSDDSQYRLGRGQRTVIRDVVGPPSATAPERGIDRRPAVLAAGSRPELRPPPASPDEKDGFGELDELAEPTVDLQVAAFGGYEFLFEHAGDKVTLILPGVMRLVGTQREAEQFAMMLRGRRS
jgi:hypothetical protein